MTNNDWLGQDNRYLADAGNGHRLHPDVLAAFLSMQDAASADGIDCQLVSAYRSFDRQVAIWNRKWRGGTTLYDASGQPLNFAELSDNDKLVAILTWSAMPGGSRHHWGTDIDVYDRQRVKAWGQPFELVDSEYRDDGPCAPLSHWLDIHAGEFGFYRPFNRFTGGVATERWHLSHRATATGFEQLRNQAALEQAIHAADLAGKAALLQSLSAFYPRYVLNKGIP
ncbi:M15 family metallopeptidase [Alteromonas sp. ASW11-19]|uniref:M15 family metallopeptidase n=1 Tax=Alteromonas salexigens TaxID=2982530 RepID=A0ABT2VKQ1_9ALTE|nr:M15 family metallopeptidase [Alteromonas salexigens]MCU7553863.1 M15 family metallopeptidase [Alteromonas salexigens]